MTAAAWGPYTGLVDKIEDGDTVYVGLVVDHDVGFDLHLAARIYARVRVLGINSPELSTAEGKAARAYAEVLLPVGTTVQVLSQHWDKYGGRVDGSITLPDGRDYGQVMLASGHARPYHVT